MTAQTGAEQPDFLKGTKSYIRVERDKTVESSESLENMERIVFSWTQENIESAQVALNTDPQRFSTIVAAVDQKRGEDLGGKWAQIISQSKAQQPRREI